MLPMNAGNRRQVRRLLQWVALLFFVAMTSAGAIDNPDAPDRIRQFEMRALSFERNLAATDGGSASTAAGQAYARFLDAELNSAYRLLLLQLKAPAREALQESQRQWLVFQKKEYIFIEQHWTRERSGTSSSLSSAGYKTSIVKARIILLLQYASEYR